MNLPKVIADLVNAQNQYNIMAYANCFTETSIVHDEGKTHSGRNQIRNWIEDSNHKYRSVIKTLNSESDQFKGILTTEVSGTFDGSPIVLNFHFEFNEGLIQSSKISG